MKWVELFFLIEQILGWKIFTVIGIVLKCLMNVSCIMSASTEQQIDYIHIR